jgi:hypothetical protein
MNTIIDNMDKYVDNYLKFFSDKDIPISGIKYYTTCGY